MLRGQDQRTQPPRGRVQQQRSGAVFIAQPLHTLRHPLVKIESLRQGHELGPADDHALG